METKQVRYLHQMLDRLAEGKNLSPEEITLLRKNLPELPKQKTLEEIYKYVDDAWLEADDPESKEWLHELHAQLKGLKDTPAAVPALPDGMRIAEHENFGRVVVSPGVGIDRCHEIFYLDPGMSSGTDISEVEPDSLTFIDYEPAKFAHPEFLETEADYTDVPEGTILTMDGLDTAWVKKFDGWVSTETSRERTSKEFGYVRRRVLRWGWSE